MKVRKDTYKTGRRDIGLGGVRLLLFTLSLLLDLSFFIIRMFENYL